MNTDIEVNKLQIGEAAMASGVSAKMIRYYEEIGLLRGVKRTKVGYRKYTAADVHTLRFIRRSRDLGFDLSEIARLLTLWQDRRRKSSDVKRLAATHVAELNAKIEALQAMVRSLSTLVACCHGDERPECPILEELERTV